MRYRSNPFFNRQVIDRFPAYPIIAPGEIDYHEFFRYPAKQAVREGRSEKETDRCICSVSSANVALHFAPLMCTFRNEVHVDSLIALG